MEPLIVDEQLQEVAAGCEGSSDGFP